MILDSEQNNNYLKLFICLSLHNLLTSYKPRISITLMKCQNGAQASIKYVTLFLTNFYPSPVTLCHTSRYTPLKYVTHLGPPIFSSTKSPDKNPMYKNLSQCLD